MALNLSALNKKSLDLSALENRKASTPVNLQIQPALDNTANWLTSASTPQTTSFGTMDIVKGGLFGVGQILADMGTYGSKITADRIDEVNRSTASSTQKSINYGSIASDLIDQTKGSLLTPEQRVTTKTTAEKVFDVASAFLFQDRDISYEEYRNFTANTPLLEQAKLSALVPARMAAFLFNVPSVLETVKSIPSEPIQDFTDAFAVKLKDWNIIDESEVKDKYQVVSQRINDGMNPILATGLTGLETLFDGIILYGVAKGATEALGKGIVSSLPKSQAVKEGIARKWFGLPVDYTTREVDDVIDFYTRIRTAKSASQTLTFEQEQGFKSLLKVLDDLKAEAPKPSALTTFMRDIGESLLFVSRGNWRDTVRFLESKGGALGLSIKDVSNPSVRSTLVREKFWDIPEVDAKNVVNVALRTYLNTAKPRTIDVFVAVKDNSMDFVYRNGTLFPIQASKGKLNYIIMPESKFDQAVEAILTQKKRTATPVVNLTTEFKTAINNNRATEFVASLTEKQLTELVKTTRGIDLFQEVDELLDPATKAKVFKALPKEAQKAVAKEVVAQKTKETTAQVFSGYKDLSTKVLNRLVGKSVISKQFVADIAKMSDIRLSERNLINGILAEMPDKFTAKEFADRVKTELLPLKAMPVTQGKGGFYEDVALPKETRGPVKDYKEYIYESSIKTSAGNIHFHGDMVTKNYFAHVRSEKMAKSYLPGKKVLRDIEIQSDLFQKGRLEQEAVNAKYAPKTHGITPEEIVKLEPYKNTWHERILKERIKFAAKEGFDTLQIPTGKTALEIEGLGQANNNNNWTWITKNIADGELYPRLKPENLKVGERVSNGGDQYSQWIITDVLGDGKFKAVPKDAKERALQKITDMYEEVGEKIPTGKYLEDSIKNELENLTETFDISGKVDQNNPIYKFYESEIPKALKRQKPDMVRVTDKAGNEWWQVNIRPSDKTTPIEAFGMVSGFEQDEEGNITFDPAKAVLGVGAARIVKKFPEFRRPSTLAQKETFAKAGKFLTDWIANFAKVGRPSEDVLEYLSQFKPTQPVRLYRGIKPGAKADAEFESWTYNKAIAEKFAGPEGKVIDDIIDPDHILVDTTMLEDVERDLVGSVADRLIEEEVIVSTRRLPITGKIVPEIEAVDDLSILQQEARKYKSAEEFVKAQDTNDQLIKIYRGQKGNELTLEGPSAGIGRSFTKEKAIAEVYGYKGNIVEGFINKDDILKYDELDVETQKYVKSIINERIEEVTTEWDNDNFQPFEDLVLEISEIARKEGKKAIDIESFNIPSEREVRVLSLDSFTTKSQLTEIWNKEMGSFAEDQAIARELELEARKEDPIERLISGYESLRKPQDIKTDYLETLGKGYYSQVFKGGPNAKTAGEYADDLGITEEELRRKLEYAIEKRQRIQITLSPVVTRTPAYQSLPDELKEQITSFFRPSRKQNSRAFSLLGNKDTTVPLFKEIFSQWVRGGTEVIVEPYAGAFTLGTHSIKDAITAGLKQYHANIFDKEKFQIVSAIQNGQVDEMVKLVETSVKKLSDAIRRSATGKESKILEDFFATNPDSYVGSADFYSYIRKLPVAPRVTVYLDEQKTWAGIFQAAYDAMYVKNPQTLEDAMMNEVIKRTGIFGGQGQPLIGSNGFTAFQEKLFGNYGMTKGLQDINETFKLAKKHGTQITLYNEDGAQMASKVLSHVPKKGTQSISQEAIDTFNKFSLLGKGVGISDPEKLISTSVKISQDIADIIGTSVRDTSFTRKSLKHLSEKGDEGRRLLNAVPEILSNPTEIRKTKASDRFFVISNNTNIKADYSDAVVLEIQKHGDDIIVTVMPADNNYLKNFELLWRATVPPSRIPSAGEAGSLSSRTAAQRPQGVSDANIPQQSDVSSSNIAFYLDPPYVRSASVYKNAEQLTNFASGQNFVDAHKSVFEAGLKGAKLALTNDVDEEWFRTIMKWTRNSKLFDYKEGNTPTSLIVSDETADIIKSYLAGAEKTAKREREQIGRLKEMQTEKNLSNITMTRARTGVGIRELKNATDEKLDELLDLIDSLEAEDKFLTPLQIKSLKDFIDPTLFNKKLELITQRELQETYAEISDVASGKLTQYIENALFPTVDLKEKNPLVRRMVDRIDQYLDAAEGEKVRRAKQFDEMLTKAEASRNKLITDKKELLKRKIFPTNEEIFRAMSGEKVDLTKEEAAVVAYLKNYFTFTRQELQLEKYRKNYITHIQKPLIEQILKNGIIKGTINTIKGLRRDDLANRIPLNIMLELDNIVGSEKFFRFALERKGGVDPTFNLRKIFNEYNSMFETKYALDQTIPEGQAIMQLLLKPRTAMWAKKFMQNLKGRGLDTAFRNGKMGWMAKAADRIIDVGYYKLLGVNPWSGVKNLVAGEANNFITQDFSKFLLGKARMASSPRKVREIMRSTNLMDGAFYDYVQKGMALGKGIPKLRDAAFIFQRAGEWEIRGSLVAGELTAEEWATGVISLARVRELKDLLAIAQGVFTKVDSPLWFQTWYGRMFMQMNRWRVTNFNLIRRLSTGAREEFRQGNKAGPNTQKLVKAFIMYGLGMYFSYELSKAGYKNASKAAKSMAEGVNSIVQILTLQPIVDALTDNPSYSGLKEIAYTIQELAAYIGVPGVEEPRSLQFQSGIEDTYISALNALDGVFQQNSDELEIGEIDMDMDLNLDLEDIEI